MASSDKNAAETADDVFGELDVDRLEVNVIESLCFSCGKTVSTRRAASLGDVTFRPRTERAPRSLGVGSATGLWAQARIGSASYRENLGGSSLMKGPVV